MILRSIKALFLGNVYFNNEIIKLRGCAILLKHYGGDKTGINRTKFENASKDSSKHSSVDRGQI